MSYPQIGCPKRTDKSFRNRLQPEHHKIQSIIEELNEIDMIVDFPTSDPLHLLELGLMKRCLFRWNYGTKTYRNHFNKNELKNLNQLLVQANKEMPSEIHRSVRTFDSLHDWKGTEFRTFLLYVGIVVLKDYLIGNEYIHFLKLICATILCSTEFFRIHVQSNDGLAQCLFEDYVESYIDIYGEESISSNIHNLIHVVDDVRRFGNLNTISAYPFENSLRLIKLRLRNCNAPLEQISRRISEINSAIVNDGSSYSSTCLMPKLKFSTMINDTPAYQTIKFDHFCLSSRKNGDKWFLTKCGKVVEFSHAANDSHSTIIHGNYIQVLEDFFKVPFSSSRLFIFTSIMVKGVQITCKPSDIRCKLVRLSYRNSYVFLPLVHTLE